MDLSERLEGYKALVIFWVNFHKLQKLSLKRKLNFSVEETGNSRIEKRKSLFYLDPVLRSSFMLVLFSDRS